MGKDLIFLGWDKPVIQSMTEWLLPAIPADPPDFSRTLILTPTRQSGRRLRQALAARCAEGGTGLLGLHVATPVALLEGGDTRPDAPPMLLQAVWASLLRETKPDAFPALLPVKWTDRSFRWCLQTGSLIQRLRDQLAENALSIADVPDQAGDRLAEPERWKDLAKLEEAYLAILDTLGFADPCTRKCRLPDKAAALPDVDTLIVAGVPDPPDLVIRLLDLHSRSMTVKVLVHAPADQAALFDDWGRPLPEPWSRRNLDIPDESKTLILAADPEDQARRVMAELNAQAGLYGTHDVAIGVPDPEVAPYMAQELAERNIKSFDPAEPSLSQHPVCRLLALLQSLAAAPVYRTLADLLRHQDVLEALTVHDGLSPIKLLAELDLFQNIYMPAFLDDFSDDRLAGRLPDSDRPADTFPVLAKALRRLTGWREILLNSDSPMNGVRLALQEVYGHKRLSDDNPDDREFTAVAAEVNDAVSEMETALTHSLGLDRSDALELLTLHLAGRTLAREHDQADLDLEGWLELNWNPSPFLLVTGFNEGRVPDSRMGDVFLPDSLRAHLGMRSDSRRFARDFFLLESLLRSRCEHGAVRLLCGKTSAAGDPLKPSRLLFQCTDEQLPARAARLFAEIPSAGSLPAATISFKLQPVLPGLPPLWPADKRISVTAFRDYLECPFRFYLKHLVRMEPLDDLKTETDAMEFGQLIHHALQTLHANPDLSGCADEKRLRDALREAARGWMENRYGRDWSLPLRIVLEAAQNRLAAAAKRQAAEAANGWTILSAEQSWTLPLGGLTVKGKIDRIDYHAGTNTARILDYKTSSRGKPCHETHLAGLRDDTPPYAILSLADKQRRWIDLQLPLYAHMWQANPLKPGARLQVGYFLLPPALEDTRVQVWEDLEDTHLESARRCAEGVCESVRKGLFWPPAARVEYDDPFRTSLGGDPAVIFKPLLPGGAS